MNLSYVGSVAGLRNFLKNEMYVSGEDATEPFKMHLTVGERSISEVAKTGLKNYENSRKLKKAWHRQERF